MSAKKQDYIDDLLAECFAYFEQGLCCDETNDADSACGMYERGLEILKLAEKHDGYKDNENYKNLVETKKKVVARLKELKKKKGTKKDGAIVEKNGKLTNEIREHLQAAHFPEAELIFYIPSGVQLFMIENEDASVPTYPSALEIFKLNENAESSSALNADAFMKVGPWTYPLKSGTIPILKNEFGAYVMPNPTPDHPNMFVGLLLPANLEENVEKEFVRVLKLYAEVRDQNVSKDLTSEERKRLSSKIAGLLIKGGENIAWGVTYAAEKTSKMVSERSTRYRSTITPAEQPMKVNPLLRTGVYCVHGGSKVVAKCTRFLLNKIGDMGVDIGRRLASGAERSFGGRNNEGFVSGTITVLAGGITSASTVWIALENASKILCKNIANETVETVKQKYGDDASITAHNALYATGHTTLAALQLYDLGPRAIAGGVVRRAGVQLVKDLHDKVSVPKHLQAGNDLQQEKNSSKRRKDEVGAEKKTK